jgi:hypothetical protein
MTSTILLDNQNFQVVQTSGNVVNTVTRSSSATYYEDTDTLTNLDQINVTNKTTGVQTNLLQGVNADVSQIISDRYLLITTEQPSFKNDEGFIDPTTNVEYARNFI